MMGKNKAKEEEEQRNFLVKAVRSFYKMTITKRNVENAFNEEKIDFENAMDVLYKRFADNDGDVRVPSDNANKSKIRVHKVQVSNVNWDIKKLKELLGKANSESVITQKCYITNFPLLVELAKEYGIPWKRFKQCVEYEYVVLDKELDKLVDLGKVDGEEVKKCATVKLNKPYYKLTEE